LIIKYKTAIHPVQFQNKNHVDLSLDTLVTRMASQLLKINRAELIIRQTKEGFGVTKNQYINKKVIRIGKNRLQKQVHL